LSGTGKKQGFLKLPWESEAETKKHQVTVMPDFATGKKTRLLPRFLSM